MFRIARRTQSCLAMSWVLVVAVLLGTVLAMPKTACADNTDITNAVTSITVDPSTITTNDDGEVTVSFSADNYKSGYRIRTGDYIDVSWGANTEDAVYLRGCGMSIDVVDEGDIDPATNEPRVIGTATVGDNNLHIVFNEAASYKQKREGKVTFTVMACSSSSEFTAHSGIVAIKAGDSVTCTVTVSSPAAQSDSVISAAGSWQLIDINGEEADYDNSNYDKVQWTISVYGDKVSESESESESENYDSIVVADDLPDGLKLDSGSVRLVIYKSDGTYLNKTDFGLENNGTSGSPAGVSYDGPSNTLYFRTTRSWLRNNGNNGSIRVDIEFQTNIVDRTKYTAGTKVRNSTITYEAYHDGNWKIDDGASAFVQIPSGSGVATGGSTGEITVTKVVSGSDVTIPQVTFRLYMLDGEGGSRRSDQWYAGNQTLSTDESGNSYIEAQTNADGVAVFGATYNGLSDGYYQLVEVADGSHDWLTQSSEPIEVQLSDTTGRVVEKTVGNDVKTVDVTATKQWHAADGSTDEGAHPTIYFKLYRYTGSDASSATAVDTDLRELPSGTTTVTWESMARYDTSGNEYHYLVKEVDASGNEAVPAGYENAYGTGDDGATDYLTIVNTELRVTPKTGDESHVEGIASLSAAALAALIGAFALRRRQTQR
jgi:hypothetical protein